MPASKVARRAKTPPLSDLMRTRAAVEYCQRSRTTIYRWSGEGLIKRYKVGAAAYWSKTELDALVTVSEPDRVRGGTEVV